MDYEPLHDIQGHLSNLFDELPFIVGEMEKELEGISKNNLHKEKINCSDLRCLVIKVVVLRGICTLVLSCLLFC